MEVEKKPDRSVLSGTTFCQIDVDTFENIKQMIPEYMMMGVQAIDCTVVSDAINQLNNAVKKQELEIGRLKVY